MARAHGGKAAASLSMGGGSRIEVVVGRLRTAAGLCATLSSRKCDDYAVCSSLDFISLKHIVPFLSNTSCRQHRRQQGASQLQTHGLSPPPQRSPSTTPLDLQPGKLLAAAVLPSCSLIWLSQCCRKNTPRRTPSVWSWTWSIFECRLSGQWGLHSRCI